ncbi:uncharacterized protein LY79DRAFT_240841 [Colletotrichum navitas]|uniref:Uncharacterized protein n=1 Tax=Colletotrichum navitas TaxID=681940 RepID=A0AAD8PXS0_9PEZI|nr:uncharacterized protein LY79DRAFT_240841 [Colletotrichum navitas]KAK1586138.1 hypothetical protein LY79DRAFT_240841 [Colletotrichum navitas]
MPCLFVFNFSRKNAYCGHCPSNSLLASAEPNRDRGTHTQMDDGCTPQRQRSGVTRHRILSLCQLFSDRLDDKYVGGFLGWAFPFHFVLFGGRTTNVGISTFWMNRIIFQLDNLHQRDQEVAPDSLSSWTPDGVKLVRLMEQRERRLILPNRDAHCMYNGPRLSLRPSLQGLRRNPNR